MRRLGFVSRPEEVAIVARTFVLQNRSSLSLCVACAFLFFCISVSAADVVDEKPHRAGFGGGGEDSAGKPEEANHKLGAFVKQLGDVDYGVRAYAFQRLLSQGAEAIEPLEQALGSSDAEVRTRAAELLIQLRGRGFLGIGLSEEWNGDQPRDFVGPQDAHAGAGAEGEDEQAKDAGETPVRPPSYPVVKVSQVIDNYPAKKAGLLAGDLVLFVNGESIHGMYDLMRIVILAGPSKPSMVGIERDGKRFSIPIVLGRNPADHPPVDLLKSLDPEPLPNR